MNTRIARVGTALGMGAVMLVAGPRSAASQDEDGERGGAVGEERPAVPEDLLDDEHVREEFGVNQFTTPSIKKVFEDLASLGKLPYDRLRREPPKGTPRDRVVLALSLGTVIADGFLAVAAERIDDLEPIGRSILKHAKVIGAGTRVTRHTKSLLESSALGQWEDLKRELAATQADVEAEMVLLRDVEVAHLIALGGWLRAFEIASVAAGTPFSEEKSRKLGRIDIAEYFLFSLEGLAPELQDEETIVRLRQGLMELRDLVDVPEGKAFTEGEVATLQAKAAELVKVILDARER